MIFLFSIPVYQPQSSEVAETLGSGGISQRQENEIDSCSKGETKREPEKPKQETTV